jgi:type I restriction enzyme S subunit
MAQLEYGDSLANDIRNDGAIKVYGSNGPVGTHDRPNTSGPVIVIGRKGSFGKVQYSSEPVFAIDTTYFIDGRSTDADLRWLYYLLQTSRLDELSEDVGVPGLSREKAYAVRVSLVPLAVQREIADFLDSETARIDALIEKKRRMIDALEERRIAIASACVTNPTWPHAKLTLLARLGSGHTPSRERPDWWEDPTIPWITTGDVQQMRGDRIEFIEETKFAISELGLANSAAELHPTGTVVLSRTASVGFSAIMARPMATSQDFATWTCGPRLNPRFLLLVLRAMRQELLGRLAMGSTHKTIYMPDIEAIRVPLPSIDEQSRAVEEVWERLRPIDSAVDAIASQIDLLRERRQALITAAVTGQLDLGKAAA